MVNNIITPGVAALKEGDTRAGSKVMQPMMLNNN